MSNGGKQVRAEVSFSEYKEARTSGRYGDKPKEVVLMEMFAERGIELNPDGKPTPPAEVITDTAMEVFAVVQG